jgi:oligopeptide transport system permease protein
MLSFALRRLLTAIPTLLVLLALAFVLIRVAPGGPFDSEKQLPPEIEARLSAAYHLDEPLYQQFGRYLLGLMQGDFGPSFQYKDYTVTELIGAGFPVSLKLGGLAMLLALLVGISVGTLAALRQNSRTDHVAMAAAMTGISIPNFVMAPLMVLLFAVTLRWLPAGGLGDFRQGLIQRGDAQLCGLFSCRFEGVDHSFVARFRFAAVFYRLQSVAQRQAKRLAVQQ